MNDMQVKLYIAVKKGNTEVWPLLMYTGDITCNIKVKLKWKCWYLVKEVTEI